jgi:hypothetical protein
MPNEIMIKIKVENDSAKGYDEARAEARKFAAELKEELDKAFDIKIKVDDEEAKVKVKEFEEELARLNGDDATVKIKVKEEDVKEEATKVKGKLKEEMSKDDGGAGKGWAKSFTNSLQSFDFKPGLMPVGIAIGAAFAPLLGASIAGLVVGGLGLGGIVGGVIVAAKDARVQAAFASMKHDLGAALKLDAAPFVPVVISGITAIENTFKRIDLKGIFKDLAPQVMPVLSGVLDLITSLGESIRNIAANSGPVLKELGTDFRNLGNTLEAAFNSLADNPKQEAQALHDLFAVIDFGITSVFALVNALTELYGVFHTLVIDKSPFGFYELMQDHSQKVTGAVNAQVSAVVAAINANNGLAGSSKAAAAAAAAQTKAINDTADALKAATDPAFALIDAQKQVNTAQTAYNKASANGRQNSAAAKSAMLDLEKATISYVSAASKAGSGTGHLTAEQKALLRSANASNATIKALDTSLHNAWLAAHKLDGFNIDITVNEIFKQTGKYISPSQISNPVHLFSGLASGGIKGAASGATSSGLTWVGESGPELMALPAGTSVKSHGDSQRMAGGMDGADGPRIVQLHVDGVVLAQAMLDPQRKIVRQLHGGSVQAAYGAN